VEPPEPVVPPLALLPPLLVEPPEPSGEVPEEVQPMKEAAISPKRKERFVDAVSF
jgi:hypothetical protein